MIIKSCNAKGDVTRDDSQRQFLAQHSVCNIVSNSYKIVPTLHRCVELKIVAVKRPA